jgi:hypothetical protein
MPKETEFSCQVAKRKKIKIHTRITSLGAFVLNYQRSREKRRELHFICVIILIPRVDNINGCF